MGRRPVGPVAGVGLLERKGWSPGTVHGRNRRTSHGGAWFFFVPDVGRLWSHEEGVGVQDGSACKMMKALPNMHSVYLSLS